MRYVFLSFFLLSLLAGPQAAGAKEKNSLSARYKKWLNEDVVYLITDGEKKDFLKLENDDSRENFIEQFWEIRNPERGSKTNRFKEEHYARIAYANQTFGRRSNTPGWMTDQGRAWILFGKPASQAHFTGYSQIYPLDLWFYDNNASNPALPSFFYLLFYMPEDIGEYRFYRPTLDGPLKLVRGSRMNSNADVYKFLAPLGGDVARAAFTLIPGEPIDTVDYTVSMGSDMLINKIENLANDSFNASRLRRLRALNPSVISTFLASDDRPLQIESIVLADPIGQLWLDYSVLIDRQNFGKRDTAGNQLQVELFYSLKNDTGQTIIEDSQNASYPAFDGSGPNGRFMPFQVAGRLPVVPGKYRLEVQVTNRGLNRVFHGQKHVVVAQPGALAFEGPLLIDGISSSQKPDPSVAFQYFGTQFQPSALHRFGSNKSIRVLFQLQAPQTSPVEYEIQYAIAHLTLRDARSVSTDSVSAESFRAGRLLTSKSFSLSGLPDGEYRLAVSLRAKGSGEVLASGGTQFRIGEVVTDPPLYFVANGRQSSSPAVASYIRGLESLAQKNEAAATAFLNEALDLNPTNVYAGDYLMRLYFSQKSFTEITRLYDRFGIETFKSSPDTLARICLSFWQTGQKDRAKDLLATAHEYFPDNPTIKSTAGQIH